METFNDFFAQKKLDVPRVLAVCHLLFQGRQFLIALEAQQVKIAPHHLIGDRHQFAKHFIGCISDADIVVQRLGHFLHTVKAFQQR